MSAATPLALYDYDLPRECIADRPAEPRGASRILVLDRRSGAIRHRQFGDLVEELGPGDVLVRNDTAVIPARLRGRRESGGGVEALLIAREPDPEGGSGEVWRCLARPSNRLREGQKVTFRGGLEGSWLGNPTESGERRLRLFASRPVAEILEEVGEIPLPPYLERPADDRDREWYQTVYARERGSVAAPTAGLHFSTGLFDRLEARGVEVVSLTLHVGPGTFLPIRTASVEAHSMLAEWACVPAGTAEVIRSAKHEGRRVVAVGTTTVRALEGLFPDGSIEARSGPVSLFIAPGHRFQVVDSLVTNFHLPRSTLLVLVAAFAGRESVLAAYREAIGLGYRFYSYGDAMLVLQTSG